MAGSLKAEVSSLLSDTESGASALFLKTIDLCLKIIRSRSNTSYSPLKVCDAISARHPYMGNLRALSEILAETDRDSVERSLLKLKEVVKLGPELVGSKVAGTVASKVNVTTISFSGTVSATLLRLKEQGKLGRVYTLVSTPLSEGVSLAAYLKHRRVDAQLVHDSQMSRAVLSSSLVMCGADAVIEGEGIINKIGSRPLAACAKEAGKEFWVIADSSKVVSNHVGDSMKKGLSRTPIRESLFEYVPSELVSRVFTDELFQKVRRTL
ncbi:MAG: hypothetical protein QXI37_01985 [Thermoprotei archaeon]